MSVSVVVEDGSGITGANAYLSVEDWKAYADQFGLDYSVTADGTAYTDDQIGSAIIRARSWLDTTYRSRWPGAKANGREQSTAWPRKEADDVDGENIADDEVPSEVIVASAEAAWRELQAPGSLSPDLERGGAVQSIKAGSVEIVYADGAPLSTVYSGIDGILNGLLVALPSNTNVSWPARA
jgi:hypothetical protein